MTSPVTALTTSGPVTNMWAFSFVMMTKSVMAGEYTAPPAHGPRMTEICGMNPEAWQDARKIRPYMARPPTPSWMRAPPESSSAKQGTPCWTARSMRSVIF